MKPEQWELNGLRFAGVEKNVGVPETAGTAWRHIGYLQVPDALIHEKCYFSYFLRNRNRPMLA